MLMTVCSNTSFMFPISYFKNKGNNKQINRDELKQGYIVPVVCGSGLIELGGVLITLLTCIRVQKCKDRRCVILRDIYVKEINIL